MAKTVRLSAAQEAATNLLEKKQDRTFSHIVRSLLEGACREQGIDFPQDILSKEDSTGIARQSRWPKQENAS